METSRIELPAVVESSNDESVTSKLAREAQVLLGGIAGGVKQGASDALADPWNTGLKLAGSVAVGVGLTYLQRGAGIGKLAAQVIAGGMGISFLSDVVSPGRLGSTGAALRDTWLSPSNMERNQAVIEKNLGRFAFDAGLMVAGGLGGAFLGRQLYPKLPLWEGASTRLEMPKAASTGTTSGKSPFGADSPRRPGAGRQPDLAESIDWTNKINVAKQPDGSLTCQFGRLDKMGRRLVTRQPDGVEITDYWDGAQKVKHVDGTAITTYDPSGTRLRKTERPDGSWLLEYKDGRQVSSKY